MYIGDSYGKFIVVSTLGFTNEYIRGRFKVCPECGSSNLRAMILHCWRNDNIAPLIKSGKIQYGYGAYDRIGTRPETQRCLDCGCRWHNMADIIVWDDAVKHGGLTVKDFT